MELIECACPCGCGCREPEFTIERDGWCLDCTEGHHEIPPANLISWRDVKALREIRAQYIIELTARDVRKSLDREV